MKCTDVYLGKLSEREREERMNSEVKANVM